MRVNVANHLTGDWPAHNAVTALRDRLVQAMLSDQPSVGTPLPSDGEIVQITRLSRSTVRRALTGLHREGWIERRGGIGSFVGPRVCIPHMPSSPRKPQALKAKTAIVRVAILIREIGDLQHDWYTPDLLAGLDSMAEEQGIRVELLGERTNESDLSSILRRLQQAPPDVLLLAEPYPRHMPLILEAEKLGIRCIRSGLQMDDPSLSMPSVAQDDFQGGQLATQHLLKLGHTRIGYVQLQLANHWTFERCEGYLATMEAAGLEADANLVLRVPTPWPAEPYSRYLKRHQPTALIFSSGSLLIGFGQYVKSAGVEIPRDLSVVSFDQFLDRQTNLNGILPTTIGLPLTDMGRELAKLARSVCEESKFETVKRVPFVLLDGQSVRSA